MLDQSSYSMNRSNNNEPVEERWTGPIALAPKHIRHRFLSEGVRRFAFGEAGEETQRQVMMQHPIGLLAASWSEGIPGASVAVLSSGSSRSPSDVVSPALADDGNATATKTTTMSEQEERERRRRSSAAAAAALQMNNGFLSATNVKGRGIKRETSDLLMALSSAKAESSRDLMGDAEKQDRSKNNVRNEQIGGFDANNNMRFFRRWNKDDTTAQTMLIDHVDRAIQKKPTTESDRVHAAALAASLNNANAINSNRGSHTTMSRSLSPRGAKQRATMTNDDGSFGSLHQFTDVLDPLQSFLFMRLTRLPFMISNSTIRRKLLLDADRQLHGKNAGSVFLLGPEAAAARDKLRDQERIADPTFGWVEGVQFIDSDNDDEDNFGDFDENADPFNASSTSGLDLPQAASGSFSRRHSNMSEQQQQNDSTSFSFNRSSSLGMRRGGSMASNLSGRSTSGIDTSNSNRKQRNGRQAGEDGEGKIPDNVDAAWIKKQSRLMTAGLLFGLDSVFGERAVGDKSYERGNRIRSLFQRNDSLNELIAWSAATCFGSIRSVLSPEDVVVGLASELCEWPQLVGGSDAVTSAANKRKKTPPPRSSSSLHDDNNHHHGHGLKTGEDAEKIDLGTQSFGVGALVALGMTEEEIQREADHEAVIHALEKRFGLGAQESNPVQAACDRAGLWFSMSQPRASTAPAHVSISDRVASYVASDKRKGAVIGFDVPAEDDYDHERRRECLLHLATAFAATLRTFLERARNPQFFREASQALPQIVALAACRIFDDIRQRAFKEQAKLKKRAVLKELTEGYAAQARQQQQQQSGDASPASPASLEATYNNGLDGTTVAGTTAGYVSSAPKQTRFMSASDLNRKLRDHWVTSTKQVHRLLLQCRRELVFLLSGVDTFKPVYRPRAGEELIPPKQIVMSTTSSATAASSNDANASPASSTATTAVVPQTKRTLIPHWAADLGVVKRHPRLQWVLKLADTEKEAKDANFRKSTGHNRNKSQKDKNKKDQVGGDDDEEVDGKTHKKTTTTNKNTSTTRHQSPSRSLSPALRGADKDDDDGDKKKDPDDDDEEKQQQTQSTTTSSTSSSNKLGLRARNIDGKVFAHHVDKNGKVIINKQQQGDNSNDASAGALESSADTTDDSKFKREIEFVGNAPILQTGSHSGQLESLTGEKRLRTPMLSWQKCEDGSTLVKRCDAATFKRVVQQDKSNQAARARMLGTAGSGGDGQQQDDDSAGGSFASRDNSFAGASFLRERSGSVMSFRMGDSNSRPGSSLSMFGGAGGASGASSGRRGTLGAAMIGGGSAHRASAAAGSIEQQQQQHEGSPDRNKTQQQQQQEKIATYDATQTPAHSIIKNVSVLTPHPPPPPVTQQAQQDGRTSPLLPFSSFPFEQSPSPQLGNRSSVLPVAVTAAASPSPQPEQQQQQQNPPVTATAASGIVATATKRVRRVGFGTLPTNPAKQRKVLYGDSAELQPRTLRHALREIMQTVSSNASELHAAASEAAADSKSMQRQRSDLRSVRRAAAASSSSPGSPNLKTGAASTGGGAGSSESEPVTVVADAIARTFQRSRLRVREEEAKKAAEAAKMERRKQRWAARQLERQFNADEGILGVDGGKFAIAVRDYFSNDDHLNKSNKSSSKAEQQNNDDDDDDADEHADLNPKVISVWDEPEEPHPLLHVAIDYRKDEKTGKVVSTRITSSSNTRSSSSVQQQQQQKDKDKEKQQTEKSSAALLATPTPILRNVVRSVPASRAALVHAYAQARNDSFANRRERVTSVSADADSVSVGLRSSVDARKVEAAVKKLEQARAKEEEALVQRGQAMGLTTTTTTSRVPRPPPPLGSAPRTSASSARGGGGGVSTCDVGPWYAQGLPKHRAPLIEQRENPFGKFHLAQGSPLLQLGMHSGYGDHSSGTQHSSSNAESSLHGRREVKWTLG